MAMQPIQRWQYRVAFDLKVRNAYGVAFQDFFSTVLEVRYGSDFIRVRPFGSLGDKGCDGYRSTAGQVFQCYGKLEDAAPSATGIAKKIVDDYVLAGGHLGTIMKEWHFAHNLVNGLPVEAVLKIEELKAAGSHVVGTYGPTSLWAIVEELPDSALFSLLGPTATAEDSQNLKLEEVKLLTESLMASIATGSPASGEVKPVPADKLAFNKLPNHWVQLLTAASSNGPYLQQYFDQHPTVETGAEIAREFARRYAALKQEALAPGDIMDALYEQITGMGSVTAVRQVAAQAVLAYLFDACDIFEDHPDKVTA
ncbi:ABC-three component system protein [Sphingobium vermicomposti]|uniref:ABC-three component systems C-terminal domain-containing protein n=1 Tax=Sphingobium vermicomposti TaxID=529005 RepID=A0A846M1J4_9SPHN|nr:ABC-three component system protein [Sphingobium vermicomposti]NIJ16037.1 hypothetical protein [Sphingobium vermicomposti]